MKRFIQKIIKLLHQGQRKCSTCGWIPENAVCDYNWGGHCSVRQYSFLRDGVLAQNGARGFVAFCERWKIGSKELP